MATVTVRSTDLTITFTRLEKLAGLIRDLTLDRSTVTGVSVVQDGLKAARGLRAPGLDVPGQRKVGTWRGRGRKTLVSLRRGAPVLRLELTGARYDEAVLSLPDAEQVAAALRG